MPCGISYYVGCGMVILGWNYIMDGVVVVVI